MTSLSLREDDSREPVRRTSRGLIALLLLLILALAGMGLVGYRMVERMTTLEAQMAALSVRADESAALARQALERATASETAARTAAELRQAAEAETAGAKQDADAARQEATTARDAAAKAQAEAAAIRKKAEAEVNRLEAALGQVAETRRTALGLVMNLGEDHLKFEFDKADLRQQDRELLSRIAGIILTSHDYTISVNGHTDDVGSDAYNRALSERRAQAVADFMARLGSYPARLQVVPKGETEPTGLGDDRDRRVEFQWH